MLVTPLLPQTENLPKPQGHAIGIADSQTECDAVIQELNSHGFSNSAIAILGGDDSTDLLKRMMEGLSWGETAEEFLKEGTIELSRGHCVLMVESRDRDQAMIVATISAKHGGRGFNYFGELIDEKLTR